jgi:hypothetical protein
MKQFRPISWLYFLFYRTGDFQNLHFA